MEMVKGGRQLVVLDDLVLDVASFVNFHPGGSFVVRHNIGRDISKYFHGAYSLENIGRNQVKNYLHSTEARRICNQLVIGKLIETAPNQLVKVDGIERDSNKTGSCKTIRFKKLQSQEDSGITDDDGAANLIQEVDMSKYACALVDHTQIGRHYLVKSSSHSKTLGGPAPQGSFDGRKHGIKRHYTEAFAMRQNVYDSLLKIGRDF